METLVDALYPMRYRAHNFFGSRINGNAEAQSDPTLYLTLLTTSSEVELMETTVTSPVAPGASLTTSSEVELMETVWRTENGGRRTESIDG